jgi:hypothetical protein
MKRTVEVSGKIRTGNSPKDYNEKRDGLSMSIPNIDREFKRQAQMEEERNKAALANSRTSLSGSFAKVRERLVAALTRTPTNRRDYLIPNQKPIDTGLKIEGKTRSNSPNSPTRGGYKTRKNKKPTILAKKPKKVNKVKKLIKNKAKV